MKKTLFCLILLACFLSGCISKFGFNESTAEAEKQTITVLAAASLTESFTEIGKQFEQENPDIQVIFNFAGSQTLFQQLEQGIPADVFASASQKYMEDAISSGFIDVTASKTFAKNALIVIIPQSNPSNIKELADLSRPGLKIVIAAEQVPVGKYTLEFLDKTIQSSTSFSPDFKAGFLANVVSYENTVKSVLNKVLLAETDAGVVYFTDVTPDVRSSLEIIEIPEALNVVGSYPIAVLKSSQNSLSARAFVDFVLSEKGQTILGDFGFLRP